MLVPFDVVSSQLCLGTRLIARARYSNLYGPFAAVIIKNYKATDESGVADLQRTSENGGKALGNDYISGSRSVDAIACSCQENC